MKYRIAKYRTFMFCGLLIGLLLWSGGCRRNLLDFDVASGGLSRPIMPLLPDNIERVIQRVLWMEQVRIWETQLQAHAFSHWVTGGKQGSLKRCASTSSCASCISGNESVGNIALACWTQSNPLSFDDLRDANALSRELQTAKLSGLLTIEVPTIVDRGGEAFFGWQQICSPAMKMLNAELDGICIDGTSGYSIKLDDPYAPSRLDVVWVVRFLVKEGPDPLSVRRLDGVSGQVFIHQDTDDHHPTLQRQAIFFEDKNILYNRFVIAHCMANRTLPAFRNCCGSVDILATDGEFQCSFTSLSMSPQDQAHCTKIETATYTLQSPFFEIKCVRLYK